MTKFILEGDIRDGWVDGIKKKERKFIILEKKKRVTYSRMRTFL
jgi:hypothetical protein